MVATREPGGSHVVAKRPPAKRQPGGGQPKVCQVTVPGIKLALVLQDHMSLVVASHDESLTWVLAHNLSATVECSETWQECCQRFNCGVKKGQRTEQWLSFK